MVLQSRSIAKSAAAAMPAEAAQRHAAARSATPPRVLHSAHTPAQLCFVFKRS
jgi:hypothetical protein